MSKKRRSTKTILVDGVSYYSDRPENCKKCFFWKNRKVGCILGEANCYYLAEEVKTEKEKECEECCYAKEKTCVGACCYKKLVLLMHAKQRQEKSRKDGTRYE